MAEWFKAAVLKTVERKFRGFESYSLRQYESIAVYRLRPVTASATAGLIGYRLSLLGSEIARRWRGLQAGRYRLV